MRQQQQQEESTPKVAGFWKWPGWHRAAPTPVITSETALTTESAATAQIDELEQAVRQRKRNLRVSRFALGGAFVAIATMLLPMLLGIDQISQLIPPLAMLGVVSLTLEGFFFRFHGARRLRQATEALTNTDDLCAVGPLTEALRFGGAAHDTAAVTLARLLPRLNVQDRDKLNVEQHACLLKELRASVNPRSVERYNPHFAVILLHALAELKGRKALRFVSRLAWSRADTAAQERIQQAAQECLSALIPDRQAAFSASLQAVGSALREEPEETEVGSSRVQPETVDALMSQFYRAARVYQRVAYTILAGVGIIAGILLAAFIVAVIQRGAPPAFSSIFVLDGIIFLGVFYVRYSASRTRSLVSALADTEDLRVTGQLIGALEIPDRWLLQMAITTLTRLLPRLQASDAPLLNNTQRAILCRWLDRWAMDKRDEKRNDFTIAILRALAQVGDAQAVPSVQRLATIQAKTPAQVRVRDEAAACLPFLEVRADQQHARQTLLRAATASAEPSEVLLRPATGAITADPQTLLRPSHSLDAVEVRTNGESKGTP
jgi:hypothetical protein